VTEVAESLENRRRAFKHRAIDAAARHIKILFDE
jgi:hypothetical protein